MRNRLLLSLFLAAFVLAACQGESVRSEPGSPEKREIVLGIVAGSLLQDSTSLQPLADLLAAQLRHAGVTGGTVRTADSLEEMAAWLRSGQVDLYFDSAYPALLVSQQSGAPLVLRGWQFGRPEAQAVLFTSRSSGVQRLSDLHGRIIALQSPQSTAGFFLPVALLSENGVNLTGKQDWSDAVTPSEAGFIFTGSNQETLRAVLSGSAAAGVVDDYHYDIVFPPETSQQLAEIARTEKIPRQVVLTRPGLSGEFLAALIQTLTRLHESETGQMALSALQTTRFDTFPGGAESTMQRLRAMLTLVSQIPLP